MYVQVDRWQLITWKGDPTCQDDYCLLLTYRTGNME